MVVFNYGRMPPEEPRYGRLILRRTTALRPDSSIYSIEDLVEDIYSVLNIPEGFRGEQGHEMLEEMSWELFTERNT